MKATKKIKFELIDKMIKEANNGDVIIVNEPINHYENLTQKKLYKKLKQTK